MQKITLKIVSLSDLPDLNKIGRETFIETFASVNTPENVEIYLSGAFSLDRLAAEILNPSCIFYFALDEEKIIGYLKVNFGEAQTEVKAVDSLEIERIYVLQEYHGRKVGKMLLDQAINIARRRRLKFVWLGVWEKNLNAIGFYHKNGFIEFDKHIFKLGFDPQTDLLMRRNVN